jgi:opacity protein-like surface antigen
MRRILQFLMFSLAGWFALGAAQAAKAQDTPKVDLFGGYAYMHGNVIVSNQGISLNGGRGSLTYNYNRWFGLVFDLGAYHQGSVAGNGRTLTVMTYLFGPRVSWRKNEKVTPFGQLLLGGGHAGGTLYTSETSPLGAQNSFAMTLGGGVDWKLHPSISVRLFQAEYLRTQFANGSNNQQNNFRLSAGVVFHFGKR